MEYPEGEDAEPSRAYRCRRYAACLDRAARLGTGRKWPDDCASCARRADMSPAEWFAELIRDAERGLWHGRWGDEFKPKTRKR